jgi:hypothetical protein
MIKRVLLSVAFVGVAAGSASAQQLMWNQTFLAGVNVGAQASGSRDESSTFTFGQYGETATVTTERSVPSGLLFDVFGAARLRGNFGVAGVAALRNANSDGAVSASIPDPIFFDRPRSVTATVSDMRHRERWAGAYGAYMMKIDEKSGILFMGGPMIVAVDHTLPASATVAEGSGSPTVTVATTEFNKLVWGFGAGADYSYMVTPNVGFGAQARYTYATANLNDDVKITLGGLQVTAGLRISFSSK